MPLSDNLEKALEEAKEAKFMLEKIQEKTDDNMVKHKSMKLKPVLNEVIGRIEDENR